MKETKNDVSEEQSIQVFEDEIVHAFEPETINIDAIVESCKGITIQGINDDKGYKEAFIALQLLKKSRTTLTKFAKSFRDEYTAKNKKIKEIENKYLAIIEPVENDLKSQRKNIDELKKIEERKILLPLRIKMLKEINIELLDEEILKMDEGDFSQYYSTKKSEYDQAIEEARLLIEEEKAREEAMKKQIEEAAERAKKEAERIAEEERIAEARRVEFEREAERKQAEEAIARVKLEAEEAERKRVEEAMLIEEEKKRVEAERIAEEEKAKKNKEYQEWSSQFKGKEVRIERNGDTFIAWEKIGEIII